MMQMGQIVCRRLKPGDADAMSSLVQRTICTSFPMFPRQAIDDYLIPWTTAAIEVRLNGDARDVCEGAFVEQQLVGIVSGTQPEAGVGTVIWLLVEDGWRGKGVGRALYEAACNAYRSLGAHKMKLTSPSADASLFYQRCGMQIEGTHPAHWYKLDFTSLGVAL